MRIKLSGLEWATLRLAFDIALDMDDEFRERLKKTWFTVKREKLEEVHKRVIKLPLTTKAALKALVTRAGVGKEDAGVSWLWEDHWLPDRMGLRLDGEDWLAVEQVLCLVNAVEHNDNMKALLRTTGIEATRSFSEKGEKLARKLLDRVLQLPRRSRIGLKGLAARVGANVKIDLGEDYRDPKMHDHRLLYDVPKAHAS